MNEPRPIRYVSRSALSFVLLILAVIAFVVATVIGFNWVDGHEDVYGGWLGLGAVLLTLGLIF